MKIQPSLSCRCLRTIVLSLAILACYDPATCAQEAAQATAADENPGVVVFRILPDSAAESAGIQVGDRVLASAGQPVNVPVALFLSWRNRTERRDAIPLRVLRGTDPLTIHLDLSNVPLGPNTGVPAAVGLGVRPFYPPGALELFEKSEAAWAAGMHEESIRHIMAAAEAAEDAGDRLAAAWLYYLGGYNRYERLGKFKESRRALEAAMTHIERTGETAAQFRLALVLGRTCGRLNDYQARRHWAQRTYELSKQTGFPTAAAQSLGILGGYASAEGDYHRAYEYYAESLAIRQRLFPDSLDLASSLSSLGSLNRTRGDLDAAREYYERSLAIHERLGAQDPSVPSVLNGLGIVVRSQGDPVAAKHFYERALAFMENRPPISAAEMASYRGNQSALLNNLGVLAAEEGELATSQDYYERALATSRGIAPGSISEAIQLGNLGYVARRKGDLDLAHDYYKQAMEIQQRLAPNSLEATSKLQGLASIASQQGRSRAALAYLEQAVAIVERHREQINTVRGRSMLVAEHVDVYDDLLRMHLSLDDLPAAFAVLERSRARGLLELLAERTIDFRESAPEQLLTEQAAIGRQQAAAYSQLARMQPDRHQQQIDRLHTQLTRLDVRQRDLEGRIRASSPEYAALEYPQPMDLEAAAIALDPGTLLLSYHVGYQQTYLFALLRLDEQRNAAQRVTVFPLDISQQELRRNVLAFRRSLVRKEPLVGAGRALYQRLLAPARDLIDQAERILICPDDVLHALPFAALVVNSGPQQPRYLAEEKPLHSIVSVTTYGQIRDTAPPPSKPAFRLLAFGGADYGGQSAQISRVRGLVLGAAGEAGPRQEDSPADNNDLFQPLPLGDLPGTRTEVETIVGMYGSQAQARVGAEATERAAKQESGNARMLHFACHGLLDNRDPLASGLALSRSESEPEEDGILRAWEIFENLKLNADLVVLSACETGLGRTTKHEGVVGLTRALQYAGARSIVVSLWSVSDESTTELMKAFYTHLREGASKDVALGRAMAHVRANPRWQHPFYWAPFTLVGDWQEAGTRGR